MKAKYLVKDGFNGDVVYKGNDLNEAKKAMRIYDDGCEGDWLPLCGTLNSDTGKYKRIAIYY